MQIDSFRGIRNTSPIRSIPDNALYDAVDVRVDQDGIQKFLALSDGSGVAYNVRA